MKRNFVALVIAAGLMTLLLMVPAGCGTGRDTSSLSKALLGHWKNVSPGTYMHIYYSPTEATFDARGGGEPSTLTYNITQENQGESWLMVQYAYSPEPLKISLSKDRNSFTEYPSEMPRPLRYRYVDSKQEP
jgi:hypothetical protein